MGSSARTNDVLALGRWYDREGQRSRMISSIKGEVVSYTVDGLLTLVSLTMPADAFRAWVDGK